MDKNSIKKYAVWARRELISRVSQKALQYGISEKEIVDTSADSINGYLLSANEKKQRQNLINRIKSGGKDGFQLAMEEAAYTWFNRFSALRFMEVNGYLPTHIRVFTDEQNAFKPQILAEAIHLELDGLNMEKVYELKDQNKTDELYKYLLITQCNALSAILPGMFTRIADYTELLFPDNLLREGSVIEQMISMIPEDDWKDAVQIIGWLYQYYIYEKHEEVVDPLHGKVVKKEEVPAATQLFTTDWVVRYLIDNSVGRYWIERNPNSTLADKLAYFVKPKNGEIKHINEVITPQKISTFDPCVGSGHFLIYAFDVLMKIYVEYGYTEHEAAAEIVKNNLFGLDIDSRAVQLAYFSVMMKARQYDRRFFTRNIQPHVYEIIESNSVDKASIDYFCGSDEILKKDVRALLDILKNAKEYGSILQLPSVDFNRINERFAQLNSETNIYTTYLLSEFQSLMRPAEIMSGKYVVVSTNPPYLNKYDNELKKYVYEHYRPYAIDLFSIFTYRNFDFCVEGGYNALMTPNVWLFIKSHGKLRDYVIQSKGFVTLVQMAKGAFFKDATVDVCAFVLKNAPHTIGAYFRLEDFKGGMDVQNEALLNALEHHPCTYFYEKAISEFSRIPDHPIAYWASDDVIDIFANNPTIDDLFETRNGMSTTNNNKFLRMWFECELFKCGIELFTSDEAKNSSKKWFRYNKGGEFRRWYGNNDYVVNWENDGAELKAYVAERYGSYSKEIRSEDRYFYESITWSGVTSSQTGFRFSPMGAIFDSGANGLFAENDNNLKYLLGFLNSKLVVDLIKYKNPTINTGSGTVGSLPVAINDACMSAVVNLVNHCINISKNDWDSFETSWDFTSHPLVSPVTCIADAYAAWEQECNKRFTQLKENEEELNRIFIGIYGLQDGLTPDVDDKDVTVRKADLERDIRSLISYAVGCMFGRYSLDCEGLAYAGGNWDSSKYTTYPADKDNIIPICDDDYFNDDITGRFITWVETVYGEDTLEENLKFISDALGGKGIPRDVIRSYFINDFYADHLKIYQKRPIYWLFDSGKNNGFKALVYMHRYQPDTIARMRTDYVHEQQSRYRTAIADLEQRVNSASTGERVKLSKQLQKLQDQATEIRTFEERIHHLADMMISIDLDDGVKVNYAKFGDVLAKIK